MNIVPLVPKEILQCPSPTVPVPTAAAALSPAPAATITSLPDGFIGTLQKLEIQEESFGILRIERWLGI